MESSLFAFHTYTVADVKFPYHCITLHNHNINIIITFTQSITTTNTNTIATKWSNIEIALQCWALMKSVAQAIASRYTMQWRRQCNINIFENSFVYSWLANWAWLNGYPHKYYPLPIIDTYKLFYAVCKVIRLVMQKCKWQLCRHYKWVICLW